MRDFMISRKGLLFIVCSCSVVVSCGYSKDLKNKINPVKTEKSTKNLKNQDETSQGVFFAVENALKNNKQILSAQKELNATHESITQANAGFRPEASASVGYTVADSDRWNSSSIYSETEKNRVKSSEKSSEKNVGIEIRQNLLNSFKDTANVKATDKEIKAKWSEYELVKQKVAKETMEIYFHILAKQKQIDHLKSLLEARKSSVLVAKEMYASGASKYIDVLNAEASYSETETQMSNAIAELESYSAKFVETVCIPVPTKLISPEKLLDANVSEPQALDIALKNNPQIIASSYGLDAAKKRIKTYHSFPSPSLDLVYNYSQSLDSAHKKSLTSNNSRSHSCGLRLSVPIYDKGIERSKKRQTIDAANKTAITLDQSIQEVEYQLKSSYASLKAANQAIISTKQAIIAREQALHDTEEEYKAGTKIMNDVLDAQQKLWEAQYELTNAEKSKFMAESNILLLMGKLNEKFLKLNYTDFDYVSDYNQTKGKF